MYWLKSFAAKFKQREAQEELSDELRFHLEKEIELNIARGMAPEDARRRALIAFGGVQQTRESVRETRWSHWIEILLQDLRYGWRMLRKTPVFTVIVVFTLAMGIGMNTAIFSLVDELLFRPLPAKHPEELVVLKWHARIAPKTIGYGSYGDCVEEFLGTNGCSFSLPFFKDASTQPGIFSSLAAWSNPFDRIGMSSGGPATNIENVQLVSGAYFQTLGIGAALGRTLGPSDDVPAAAPAMMLSYGYWQSTFGANPAAIGTTVRLNGVPFTIAGVAEKGFIGLTPGSRVDVWLPLSVRAQLVSDPQIVAVNQESPSNWWLVMVGRRRPEVSLTQAQAALSLLFRNGLEHADRVIFQVSDEPGVDLVPAHEALKGMTADTLPPLYILMMAAGLVLLIACSTIAGLLVARAAAREKEMAVRLTLGARRTRLVMQLLAESLLLAILGGGLGLGLAHWSARVLAASILSDSSSGMPPFSPQINLRVLAFTAAVSILTGILFGLIPALRSLRADLTPALNSSSAAASPRQRHSWFNIGNSLVVVQVALAMVALICAGMLLRTLANLRSIDPGFAVNNILLFNVGGRPAGYKEGRADGLYRDLREKFAALPGVTSTGYSFVSLLSGSLSVSRIQPPGKPDTETEDVDMFPAGPGFFATMRIPLQDGRDFTDPDFVIARDNAAAGRAISATIAAGGSSSNTPRGAPLSAIVNETFAHHFFPQGNALGQFVAAGRSPVPKFPRGPGWQIVGVVRDAKYNDLRRDVKPTMYIPATGGAVHGDSAVFELRTASDPKQLVSAVREIANQVDSNLSLYNIVTEESQIDSRLFIERRVAQLSSFFGLLALALACAGIYGLLSYEVTRRTREIGIRMAVGAQQRHVVRLVAAQGLTLALAGAVIGAGASFGAATLLRTILYKIKAGDPLTLIATAVILLTVALLACSLPARRAASVDPLIALRYE
jgi:predicted permease